MVENFTSPPMVPELESEAVPADLVNLFVKDILVPRDDHEKGSRLDLSESLLLLVDLVL